MGPIYGVGLRLSLSVVSVVSCQSVRALGELVTRLSARAVHDLYIKISSRDCGRQCYVQSSLVFQFQNGSPASKTEL